MDPRELAQPARTTRFGHTSRRRGWAKVVGPLIGVLAACALALPGPAVGAAGCSTHRLQFPASGRASLQVVGLSADGFSCAKAASVARTVARELGTGRPIALAGVNGIDINSNSCPSCVSETHVSLTYRTGTINLILKGKSVLSGPGSDTLPFPALPFPALPFPRIPGFQPPTFPTIPSVPTPMNPNSGVTTV